MRNVRSSTPGTRRKMTDDTRRKEFIDRYGGIYEQSPWVAEAVYDGGNADGDLAAELRACVDNVATEKKLALIRAHPDLAGKAAVAGELSESSTEEQASARLDLCTAAEFEQFQSLNDAYHRKFGFPFVMAVRGSNRQEILDAFATRLDNDADTEFATAIAEIHKIARLRLDAL